MKNSMRHRIRQIIASLCALSTLSASPVGAWNKNNAATIELKGKDEVVLDGSPCQAVDDTDKAKKLDAEHWDKCILLENGMVLTPEGDVLLLLKAAPMEVKGSSPAITAIDGVPGEALEGVDAKDLALHLDDSTTKKLQELIQGGQWEDEHKMFYDNSVLTKASLGKSVSIDDEGFIRKGNLYLKNGSLGKQTPEWTQDRNEAGPRLTKQAKKALMTLGALTKNAAWELTHAKELHLDADSKLVGDDGTYRNYLGEKTDEPIVVPVAMSNGVEKTDFRDYDQWRSQIKLIPNMNSTRKVADAGKSDSMVVISSVKCMQDETGKMTKIDAFLTCDHKIAYCKDGKWRLVSEAAKSKNTAEQIMPAKDAATKLKVDVKYVFRGSRFAIVDRMGTAARIMSIGGIVVVTGAAGGILYYSIKPFLKSTTNQTSTQNHNNRNKPNPVPTDRTQIKNAIT